VDDPSSEGTHRLAVVGHRVVVVVPLQDPGEPASLFGDREVHSSSHLGLDRFELGAHLLLARDPLELEPSVPVLRADMRETQELERLRLPIATRVASFGGVPSELDQPRFVRMQFQAEFREPLAEIGEESLGVLAMLEARQEVVSEPREDNVPRARRRLHWSAHRSNT
jgi:hypothetical protein